MNDIFMIGIFSSKKINVIKKLINGIGIIFF